MRCHYDLITYRDLAQTNSASPIKDDKCIKLQTNAQKNEKALQINRKNFGENA